MGYKKTLVEVSTIYLCGMVERTFNVHQFAQYSQVASCYECLPRSVVQEFVSQYHVCGLQKPQRNQAPLKPILSSGFMTRGQVCVKRYSAFTTLTTINYMYLSFSIDRPH